MEGCGVGGVGRGGVRGGGRAVRARGHGGGGGCAAGVALVMFVVTMTVVIAVAVVALEDLASGASTGCLAAAATGALAQDILHATLVGFVARGGLGVVLLGAVAGRRLNAVGDCGGVEGPDETPFGFVGGVGVGDLVERLGGFNAVSVGVSCFCYGLGGFCAFTCNSEVRKERDERGIVCSEDCDESVLVPEMKRVRGKGGSCSPHSWTNCVARYFAIQ